MISNEMRANIHRMYYVNHFSFNAIAEVLGIHHQTVARAIADHRTELKKRRRELDLYVPKIEEILQTYPKMTGTRIYQIIAPQGYRGSLRQLRRELLLLRPKIKARYFREVKVIPGEQAQVDWAHCGKIEVPGGKRSLSLFVMTLSWSRSIFAYFTFDQKIETLLDCHQRAFTFFQGVCRNIVYDNMRTVVLDRVDNHIRYNDNLIEFAKTYRFKPIVTAPYQPQSKGRVERSIRYIRSSFLEGRSLSSREQLNQEILEWCLSYAKSRPWREDPKKTVGEALDEERSSFILQPEMELSLPRIIALNADVHGWVNFESNKYSVPWILAGKSLSLYVYSDTVELWQGQTKVASHRRSWALKTEVLDASHRENLPKSKSRSRVSDRLAAILADFPRLQELIYLYLDQQRDIRSLIKFVEEARDVHGIKLTESLIDIVRLEGLIDLTAMRIKLMEILKSTSAQENLSTITPGNPAARDLQIRSHSLDIYDKL